MLKFFINSKYYLMLSSKQSKFLSWFVLYVSTPEHLWFSVTGFVHLLSWSLGKNKRVGKQLASQKILQMLHPHVKNWGSLLRMYGRESNKMVKKVS